MKHNLSQIMTQAHSLYREGGYTQSAALRAAWIMAKAEAIQGKLFYLSMSDRWSSADYETSYRLNAELGDLNAQLEAVKAEGVTAVAGVTFGRRQEAIAHLAQYDAQDIALQLRREQDNPADQNAVAVWASVAGRGSYQMGYIPREKASRLAPLMDKGRTFTASLEGIVGGCNSLSYGLRVRVAG